jgi:hypothetical protein
VGIVLCVNVYPCRASGHYIHNLHRRTVPPFEWMRHTKFSVTAAAVPASSCHQPDFGDRPVGDDLVRSRRKWIVVPSHERLKVNHDTEQEGFSGDSLSPPPPVSGPGWYDR